MSLLDLDCGVGFVGLVMVDMVARGVFDLVPLVVAEKRGAVGHEVA